MLTDNDKLRLQKVIDKLEKSAQPFDEACMDLRELIKPDPTFVKGEIVEVLNKGKVIGIDFYARPSEKDGMHLLKGQEMRFECKKLDSIPINLIPHDSSERPEGLKDDDVIMVHSKVDMVSRTYTNIVKNIGWQYVDWYYKVHFLKGGE